MPPDVGIVPKVLMLQLTENFVHRRRGLVEIYTVIDSKSKKKKKKKKNKENLFHMCSQEKHLVKMPELFFPCLSSTYLAQIHLCYS